jgi:hypothetical protein
MAAGKKKDATICDGLSGRKHALPFRHQEARYLQPLAIGQHADKTVDCRRNRLFLFFTLRGSGTKTAGYVGQQERSPAAGVEKTERARSGAVPAKTFLLHGLARYLGNLYFPLVVKNTS